jgi:hypothetical protein
VVLSWNQEVRIAVVVIHTIGSYQSGEWAIGVIANGLHVLPFVPNALDGVCCPDQANNPRQSLSLFPENSDFSEPANDAQTEGIQEIELRPDYNSFL